MSESTNWWGGLSPGMRWAVGIGLGLVLLFLIRSLQSDSSNQYPPDLIVNLPGLPAPAVGGYGPAPAQGQLPVIPGLPGPNGDGSYGPFATIRRANEVVNQFQAMGYRNTIEYHNGDGRYVFPRP